MQLLLEIVILLRVAQTFNSFISSFFRITHFLSSHNYVMLVVRNRLGFQANKLDSLANGTQLVYFLAFVRFSFRVLCSIVQCKWNVRIGSL